MLTLHVFPPSPRASKVLALASHLELPFEMRIVNLMQGEQRAPAFLALNPNAAMPVLEEDGFVLWEANAILQYLASKKPELGLFPDAPRARADISRWQFWDLAHWEPSCTPFIFEHVVKKLSGQGAADESKIAEVEPKFHRYAQVLEGQLKNRKFVTGDSLTIADFSLGASLHYAQPARMPLRDYPEIRRWHASLTALPAWTKTLALAQAA